MSSKSEKLLALLDGQPVIPVLKIADAAAAVPLARALARGGLRAVEITLRTGAALEAIRRVAGEVEEAIVGAGTILDARQFEQAAGAGSRFIVAPASPANCWPPQQAARCRCCPAPSRPARSWPRARPASTS